jgi:hypothetical protein
MSGPAFWTLTMNALQWHLVLNHVPVLGMAFALFLWGSAILMRSRDVLMLASLWTIFIGIMTIAVYLTGHNGHGLAHGLPGVSHSIIGLHEQAATASLVAIEFTGILALISLVWLNRVKKFLPLPWNGLLLFSLTVSTVLVSYAAMLGGEIRHTEMRIVRPWSNIQEVMRGEH